MSRFIGLISGTSADAVDAALVEFPARQAPRLLAAHGHSLPADFRDAVLELSQSAAPVSPAMLAELDVYAGHLFAQAALALLEQADHAPSLVTAIGSHGQTLYHRPRGRFPYTWQIGDPSTIAWRTGITTVADFRRKDVAAGGQGAPLVPAFHAALLRTPDLERCVLNLGGIANITVLPADPRQAVQGFDTGPANALLDAWARRYLGTPLDKDGAWAGQGRVRGALLQALLGDPYFTQAPPKSTGRDYFNLAWLDGFLEKAYPGQDPTALPADLARDIQATLLRLSVDSVCQALAPYRSQQLLVCGGGVHNSALMAGLRAALPGCAVESSAPHGVDPDWVEAMCFAWLARQTLEGKPGNLPAVTGARCPLVLGGVYPAG